MQAELVRARELLDQGDNDGAGYELVRSGVLPDLSMDAILIRMMQRLNEVAEVHYGPRLTVPKNKGGYINFARRDCIAHLEANPNATVAELVRAVGCSKKVASAARRKFYEVKGSETQDRV